MLVLTTLRLGLLDCEIQEAHKRFIEHTPGQVPAIGISLEQSRENSSDTRLPARKKSRRAATSIETPRGPRIIRTYGSQEARRSHGSQDIFEFQGRSDGELEVVPRRERDHNVVERKGRGQTARTTSFETMSMPTTKGSSFERDMPPPAFKGHSGEQTQHSESNTIPTIADSTALQPSNPSAAPARSPSVNEAKSFHATYSNGRMPTPSMSSNGHCSESVSFGETQNKCDMAREFEIGREDRLNNPAALQEPSSSASVISPSRVITVRKPNLDAIESGTAHDSGDDELQLAPPSFLSAGSTNPIVLLSEHQQEVQSFNKISLPDSIHDEEEHLHPSKTRKRKSQKDGHADELGSDDSSIGLPKELYQARPSRSRGSGTKEELVIPTDYSKRPEANAKPKKKSRRHKTTAFVELIPKEEDENENEDEKNESSRQILPDLEIPAFNKKEGEDGDDHRKINAVLKECEWNSEPPDKCSSPKKQRGRPKKGSENKEMPNVIVGSTNVETATDKHVKSVDIDKTSKRGRPSKKSLAAVVEGSESEDNDSILRDQNPSDKASRRTEKALEETSGNIVPLKVPEKSPRSSLAPPKTSPPPPATPQKSVTNNTKGPDKHSPISGGKVPYRVGLSKRARIAPLLKMVRK